jgi:hypothetical protein
MFVSVVDKKQFTWEKRELIHFRPEIVVKKLEMRGNVTIVQKSKHNHGWPKCPAPQRNPLTRLRLPLPCPGARRAQHLKLCPNGYFCVEDTYCGVRYSRQSTP